MSGATVHVAVQVTVEDINRVFGRAIPTLVRLLHEPPESPETPETPESPESTDGPISGALNALVPWAIATALTDTQSHSAKPALVSIGWISEELAGQEPDWANPSSSIGLFGMAKTIVAAALFTDGDIAAVASSSVTSLLPLLQATLAVTDTTSAWRELVANGTVGVVTGPIPRKLRVNAAVRPESAPSTGILATIEHFSAHIAAVYPDLAAASSLDGKPGIGNSALTELSLTPGDALQGTASSRPIVAAGGQPAIPPPPPDPYFDAASWRTWLSYPVTQSPFPISRLLADARRRRIDLQEFFPDLDQPRDRLAYVRWAAAFAEEELGFPLWGVPNSSVIPLGVPPAPLPPRAPGVTVIGFLDSALGLGEAARVTVRNVSLAGEQVSTRTWRHLIGPTVAWRDRFPDVSRDIHIICLNGADLARWNRCAPARFHDDAYRIGLWFWETDTLSPEMAAGAAFVDEVWVTSAFSAAAIQAAMPSHIPVKIYPVGCDLGTSAQGSRAASRARLASTLRAAGCTTLVTTTSWLVGTSFDIASQVERKNPFGLIEAWKIAFPEPSIDRHLIIKTMNGAQQPSKLELLADAVGQRTDLFVIDADWSSRQQHDFVRALDVYASLHRSEGYGLMLLEALAVKTATIATGATGNLEFMTNENSWLVPATPHMFTEDAGPYRAGSTVSEPSITAAAEYLVLLADPVHPSAAMRERVERGHRDVAGLVDGTEPAAWIRRRLAEIRLILATTKQRDNFR
jgi:glycosyltransferase involved in cell wall biosynthesis